MTHTIPVANEGRDLQAQRAAPEAEVSRFSKGKTSVPSIYVWQFSTKHMRERCRKLAFGTEPLYPTRLGNVQG